MDKAGKLESFATEELIAELERRFAELDRARSRFATLVGVLASTPSSTVTHPAVSRAKAEYWAAWHQYKAAHPDATVAEWRRVQKHTQRKAK
jgi:hypothetical protein